MITMRLFAGTPMREVLRGAAVMATQCRTGPAQPILGIRQI